MACHLDKKPNNPAKPKNPAPSNQTPKGEQETDEKAIKLFWAGNIDFTNPAKYRDLLRESRKCDPCGFYTGRYKCEYFDSRADIKIQFEKQELPSEATLTIKPYQEGEMPFFEGGICPGNAYVPFNPYSILVPITLKGTARHWNDYKGFYVRFSGTNVSSVILRSEASTPEVNGLLSVTVYYGTTNHSSEIGTADLNNSDLEDPYGGGQGGR